MNNAPLPPRPRASAFSAAAAAATALALAFAAALAPSPARAQTCTGVPYFEACLDAIGGRAMGSPMPRDPSRIVDDIFRTANTPPLFAPQLTFGRLVVARSSINSGGCNGGISSGAPGTDPRQYTAYACQPGVPPSMVPTYSDALDWRWVQNYRVRSDGMNATDLDPCGGNRVTCGYESPWRGGMIFDLQGSANRVVVFPITDHVTDSCLEAFEYSVYLTDNPDSTRFVREDAPPDPMAWNPARLTRAYLRGWTNNYQSTGTAADMAVHPLMDSTGGEAIADSIATVWSLPCGITFRYVSIVPGNYGNPDARCAYHSNEDEFDAVAGLNEDGSALCPDRDGDGFRDASCGGNDCNDNDRAINPGATEDCRATRDVNCDGNVTRCPAATACVNGLCVSSCLEGACADGFVCRPAEGREYCVPRACAGVTCPAGEVCGPEGCQAPCRDARCPTGQVCQGGACVDLCAGVRCATNQHCVAGRCVPSCACIPCSAPEACNMASGRCELPACAALPCPPEQRLCAPGTTPRCRASFCDGVVCPLGQRCDEAARACVVDRCFGISCASGLVCRDGMCVAAPVDAGPDTGGGADSGEPDAGGMDAGGEVDAGGEMDARLADVAPRDARRNPGVQTGGCGCRTAGHGGGGAGERGGAAIGLLAAAAAVIAAARRRRRSR